MKQNGWSKKKNRRVISLAFMLFTLTVSSFSAAGLETQSARKYDLNLCLLNPAKTHAAWEAIDSETAHGLCCNPAKTECIACYRNGQCEGYTDSRGVSEAYLRSVYNLIFPQKPPTQPSAATAKGINPRLNSGGLPTQNVKPNTPPKAPENGLRVAPKLQNVPKLKVVPSAPMKISPSAAAPNNPSVRSQQPTKKLPAKEPLESELQPQPQPPEPAQKTPGQQLKNKFILGD